MRNVVLRNLTFLEKRRRILSSQEESERNGIHTHIRRNFIYQIKDIADSQLEKESPPKSIVYVLKYHNTKEKKDKFLFRLKGILYAVSNEKVYQITYLHSFRLELNAI